MTNVFLYPGIGQYLKAVAAATGNSKIAPETNTIATGGWSEGVAGHDCRELCFGIVFESAPAAGNIIIQRTSDLVTGTWETHDTIAATSKLFISWAANARLLGFYRILNSGTSVNCTVRVNKAIR